MRTQTPSRSRSAVFAAVFAASWLLGFVRPAHADIYQHTDANGVVHFSNQKGAGKLYLRTQDKTKRRSDVTPVMPSDKSPERFSRYDEHIRQAATLYQSPEELIRAVIMVESGYDPRAVSSAGAQGLMQMMPETAQRMEVRDSFDPRENIFGGTRYLRIIANLFNGDLQLTIASYNAGEGAVSRYGGIPPYAETQDYVVKVMAYYRKFRAMREAGQAKPSDPDAQ